MEWKELLYKIIVALTTMTIASLIGFIFKGRLSKLMSKFVNSKQSFWDALLLAYSLASLFLAISLSIAYGELPDYIEAAIIFFYSVVLVAFVRIFIFKTGSNSFSYIKATLEERSKWVKFFGNPEFVCNVDGIDVAFYSTDKPFFRIVYVPVDIENLDVSKWIDVDKKISSLSSHLNSIDKLKSALGCG